MNHKEYIASKIYSLENLATRLAAWRVHTVNIVFTNGCFDILHKGHLDYLAKAADLGDYLIIGLNSDESIKRLKGADRPIHSVNDRAFALAALGFVSAVIVFEEDSPIKLIESLKPNVLVKGADWEKSKVVGSDFVEANGGRVELIEFLEGYSTSSIIERIKKT